MQQQGNKWFKVIIGIGIVAILAIVSLCITCSILNKTKEELLNTRSEKIGLESEVTKLQDEITVNTDKIAKLEQENTDYKDIISDLQEKHNTDVNELTAYEAQIKELESTVNRLQTELHRYTEQANQSDAESEEDDEEIKKMNGFPVYSFEKSENPDKGSVSAGRSHGYWHYRSANNNLDYVLFSDASGLYILIGKQWYILEGGDSVLDSHRMHHLASDLEEAKKVAKEEYSDYDIPMDIPDIEKTDEWLNNH